MLAKVAPSTNEFRALARYLVKGKSGHPAADRVAWVAAQNLPTDDPMLAAAYMEATAELSARTQKAAYHLMIAWHQAEQPKQDVMQTVARQTLSRAGLAEHQALIMGHGDKPHPHLHILVNRVHPETGRAWKASHDYARFDRIMRELSETHGFTFAPAHTYNPELTDDVVKLPATPATFAAKRGANTRRPQWSRKASRRFGTELSERLDRASTVDDVMDLLAEHGLRVEAKGSGYVIGNDSAYTKLSRLQLACSNQAIARLRAAATHQKPEKRSQQQIRQHVFSVDGVDIARAFHVMGLVSLDDVRSAIDDAQTERVKRQSRCSSFVERLATSTILKPVVTTPQHRSRYATLSSRGAFQRR